jgi:hypothetical protein
MSKPNTQFELSVEDIDIIEAALQRQMRVLTERRLTHIQSTIKPEWELDSVKEIDREVKEIYSLLGRLHNQKNWYRPKDNYVGG